jgi:kynurenine formamidase
MTQVENEVSKEFEQLASEVRNWGRWGSDDSRGTLNLITADSINRAAALVRRGEVFSLSVPVDRNGPQTGARRLNPIHLMTDIHSELVYGGPMRYSDDFIAMYIQSGTQWDALSHVSYNGKMYNDVPEDAVGPHGASQLSIDCAVRGVVGRAVLLDVARCLGVDWLESGTVISPGHLDLAVSLAQTEVRAGDILLVRTGWRRFLTTGGARADFMAGEPGLGVGTVRWLRDRDVAAVCADNFAVEAMPGERGWPPMSLHMLLIRDMGMMLGEIMDFEELAEDCANDGIYEMFLSAAPLRITAGVGSPVNPLALK